MDTALTGAGLVILVIAVTLLLIVHRDLARRRSEENAAAAETQAIIARRSQGRPSVVPPAARGRSHLWVVKLFATLGTAGLWPWELIRPRPVAAIAATVVGGALTVSVPGSVPPVQPERSPPSTTPAVDLHDPPHPQSGAPEVNTANGGVAEEPSDDPDSAQPPDTEPDTAPADPQAEPPGSDNKNGGRGPPESQGAEPPPDRGPGTEPPGNPDAPGRGTGGRSPPGLTSGGGPPVGVLPAPREGSPTT